MGIKINFGVFETLLCVMVLFNMLLLWIHECRADTIIQKAAITENEMQQAVSEQAQQITALKKQIDAIQNTPPCVVPNEITQTQESIDTTAISQIMTLPDETKGTFKAYMDYRTLTDRTSKQWTLQQDATTDDNGFRKYGGRFMVALGTFYAAEAGELVDIEFENGVLLRCITGDVKDDLHTDPTNRYNEGSGCIVEFIVDTDKISKKSAIHGDMSHSGLYGDIVSIIKITDTEDVNDVYDN